MKTFVFAAVVLLQQQLPSNAVKRRDFTHLSLLRSLDLLISHRGIEAGVSLLQIRGGLTARKQQKKEDLVEWDDAFAAGSADVGELAKQTRTNSCDTCSVVRSSSGDKRSNVSLIDPTTDGQSEATHSKSDSLAVGKENPKKTDANGSRRDDYDYDEDVNKTEDEDEDIGIEDATDKELAESVKQSADGEEPLDGDNETQKEDVKQKIEKAIEKGVEHAKIKNEMDKTIEQITGRETDENLDDVLVNRTGENVSAKNNIKDEVEEAIDDTLRKVVKKRIGDNATSANGTRSNASGITSTSLPNEVEAQGMAVQGIKHGGRSTTLSPTTASPMRKVNETEKNATGEKVIEEIKEQVEQAIDKKVEEAAKEHREPTEEELEEAAAEEIDRLWNILAKAKRHKYNPDLGPLSAYDFWHSTAFFDWMLLLVTTLLSLSLHRRIYEWPSTRAFHGAALLIWLGIACIYNAFIFARLGQADGIMWMNGYILEIIFLIENVFVFHVIVKAFDMARKMTQKALFIVVALQIIFQMVFYMGLATRLRKLDILPYILGPWLLYCGYQAMVEDDNHSFNVMETKLVRTLKDYMGERLILESTPHAGEDVTAVRVVRDGKSCVSTMGLCVFCLVIADFLLEIDVTVTKIENLPKQYICFSSSVVASFAVPELFFVARDLFRKYFALKYGIGFVLLFFGAQMLAHSFINISALTNILIIMGVMIFSVLISIILGLGEGYRAPQTPAPVGTSE